MALIIWTCSKGAYRYIRETGILPLPSESYLYQRVQHITLPPGFLYNTKDVLTTKAALLTEKERAIHLSMDEACWIFRFHKLPNLIFLIILFQKLILFFKPFSDYKSDQFSITKRFYKNNFLVSFIQKFTLFCVP